MVNLNRRFFLGGAISLVAAQTFIPSVAAMSNMPTIYGDGIKADAFGLAALFRNDPVIFDKDKIAVEKHGGITFHSGQYLIDSTVEVPKDLNVEFDGMRVSFMDFNLDPSQPFFSFFRKKYIRFGVELYEYDSNYHKFEKALYVTKNIRSPFIHAVDDTTDYSKIDFKKKETEHDNYYIRTGGQV